MYSLEVEVKPDQIEPLYNHVHHAQALRFLELGRLRFLESIGQPNEVLIGKGLYLVITDIQINYKRELLLGKITVTCEDPKIDDKKIVIRQRILNHKDKEAIEAVVTSVFMSRETRRSIPPPAEFQRAFDATLGTRRNA